MADDLPPGLVRGPAPSRTTPANALPSGLVAGPAPAAAQPAPPSAPESTEAERFAEQQRIHAAMGPDPYENAPPPPSPGMRQPFNAQAPAQMVQDLHSLGEKLWDKYVKGTAGYSGEVAPEEIAGRTFTQKAVDANSWLTDLAVQAGTLGTSNLSQIDPAAGERSERFRRFNPIFPGALEAAGQFGMAKMGMEGQGGVYRPVAAPRPVGLAEAARQAQPLAEGEAMPMPQAAPFAPGRGIEAAPAHAEWGPRSAIDRAQAADKENVWATPRSIIDRAELRDQRLEDQAAAERSNVRMPPGMMMSAPLQRVTNTMAEMPFVGRGLRAVNERAYEDMAARREEIAGKFGTTSGPAELGAVAKGALENTAEMLLQRDKTDAEAIAQSLGRSTGARDVGQIAAEATQRFRDKTISPDTVREMPSADLQALKGKPASASSSPMQLSAAYELAAREIPENLIKGRSKTDESRFMGGMENTRQVLLDLAKRNQTMFSKTEAGVNKPGIGQGLGDAREITDAAYPIKGKSPVAEYVRSVLNTPITFNIQAMRGIRTHFGTMVRDLRPEDAGTVQAADLARIQQAQTADIINLLDRNAAEYAANHAKSYAVSYGGKEVKMTGKELAERTLEAKRLYFDADAMTKANKEHMETLKRFYGEMTSDQIGRAILSDAKDSSSNIGRLSALRQTLQPAEWKEVGAGVLRDMWRTPEADFAPSQFQRNWKQMPGKTKTLLFGDRIKSINDVVNSGSAEQIEALQKAYGRLPNEAVAGRILADAKEGAKGNIERLQRLFDASTPEQIGEIRAGLFRMLGRVTGDATGVASETGLNPATFAKNWKEMSPAARDMLFRDTPQRKALDDFARLAERIQRYSKQGNPSGSAYSYMGMAGMLAPFGAVGEAMGGHFGAVASMGAETAGMYAIAKFLSSPAYANWLTRAVELSGKQASAASLRSHVNTLARIAQQQRDPQAKALGLAVARAYQNQVSQGALRVLGGNAANPQNRRDKGLPPQSLRALAPPQSGRLLPAPAIGR